jgi:hypothetical protein
VVIEGTRSEDEVRAQGERIYPMCVFVQRPNQFPLENVKYQ